MGVNLTRPGPDVDPVATDGHHVHPPRPLGDVKVMRNVKRRVKLLDIPRSLPVIRVISVRDFKARYKQSALGPIWLAIQPLGIVAAFAVAFNGVTQVETFGVPYALFAFTGVCVWSYFQMALTEASQAVPANGLFIRRVPVPRHALVISGLIVALPLLASTLTFTVVAIFAAGRGVPVQVLLLPVAAAWLMLLVWGISSILASIAARWRDVLGVLPFILQAGIFVSPVAYPASQAGSTVNLVLDLNPLTGVIEFWRWCLLEGVAINTRPILIALAWTAVLATFGWRLFTRLEPTFADVS
jgi:lipopolysaccharide transport system permease protein